MSEARPAADGRSADSRSADTRRKLIEGTWAADASYIDPLAEAHGRPHLHADAHGA